MTLKKIKYILQKMLYLWKIRMILTVNPNIQMIMPHIDLKDSDNDDYDISECNGDNMENHEGHSRNTIAYMRQGMTSHGRDQDAQLSLRRSQRPTRSQQQFISYE